MSQTNLFQFNWRNVVGIVVMGIATCIDVPVNAVPIEDNFHIAQVGIRSNVSSPVPLNLRPRVIISPRGNQHFHRRRGYSRYNPYYGRRRGHHKKIIIINPGSRHHRRHIPHYGNYNHRGNYGGGAYIRIGY